jgi:hypothetical protein
MSARHERQYRIAREREIRAEQATNRVRNNTVEFLRRYEAILDDLENQNLVEYVRSDFTRLSRAVANMRSALNSNPFSAREISLSIGGDIHALPRTAREIHRSIQDAERENRSNRYRDIQHTRSYPQEEMYHSNNEVAEQIEEPVANNIIINQLNDIWRQELNNWQDKLSRSLMTNELITLRNRLFDGDAKTSADTIKSELATLKMLADQKAQEHKTKIELQAKKEAEKEIVSLVLEDLKQSANELPPEKYQSLTEQLTALNTGESLISNMSQVLEKVHNSVDEAVVDESIRKEVVKAVYQSLKSAGFVVQNPKKDKDEVVIAAHRPSGNRAKFRIELDGKLTYEFDNYKGQTCQQDMQQVLPKLSEIYGVNLSDARVLWTNPDDLDNEMKPIPSQTMNRG